MAFTPSCCPKRNDTYTVPFPNFFPLKLTGRKSAGWVLNLPSLSPLRLLKEMFLFNTHPFLFP